MVYLLFFSIIGILNAVFLNWQYNRFSKSGIKMFCFLGEDCSRVVGSAYGRHLGLKNEIIGVAYYLGIIVYALIPLFSIVPFYFTGFALVAGGIATLFSFYLLYLQAFILKTYCSWCLIAILINFLIFASLLTNLHG